MTHVLCYVSGCSSFSLQCSIGPSSRKQCFIRGMPYLFHHISMHYDCFVRHTSHLGIGRYTHWCLVPTPVRISIMYVLDMLWLKLRIMLPVDQAASIAIRHYCHFHYSQHSMYSYFIAYIAISNIAFRLKANMNRPWADLAFPCISML